MPAPPFSEGDEKVRKLKMDICDYYGNAVCNLYDNEASIMEYAIHEDTPIGGNASDLSGTDCRCW